MQRIGVLMGFAESDPEVQAFVAAFRVGLEKLGWAEGRNIRIDGGRRGVDATVRQGTRRAAARTRSFGKHTHHRGAA
jgi:hypothetical protein